MIVPVSDLAFEIPVCLLNAFRNIGQSLSEEFPDKFVISLFDKGSYSRYKAFDRVMTNTLNNRFSAERLQKLPDKKDPDIYYYGAKGMLFSKDMQPLMMASWKMEWQNGRLTFISPVLRISSPFFLEKHDSIGRFVCKKLVNAFLLQPYFRPPINCNTNPLFSQETYCNPELIVGNNWPFTIEETNAPSYSTTTHELLQTVLDNVEDVQWK